MKGPSEDGLKNSIRKGRELGKPLVVAGCVPQGQKNHPDIQGLSVVGVGGGDRWRDEGIGGGERWGEVEEGGGNMWRRKVGVGGGGRWE